MVSFSKWRLPGSKKKDVQLEDAARQQPAAPPAPAANVATHSSRRPSVQPPPPPPPANANANANANALAARQSLSSFSSSSYAAAGHLRGSSSSRQPLSFDFDFSLAVSSSGLSSPATADDNRSGTDVIHLHLPPLAGKLHGSLTVTNHTDRSIDVSALKLVLLSGVGRGDLKLDRAARDPEVHTASDIFRRPVGRFVVNVWKEGEVQTLDPGCHTFPITVPFPKTLPPTVSHVATNDPSYCITHWLFARALGPASGKKTPIAVATRELVVFRQNNRVSPHPKSIDASSQDGLIHCNAAVPCPAYYLDAETAGCMISLNPMVPTSLIAINASWSQLFTFREPDDAYTTFRELVGNRLDIDPASWAGFHIPFPGQNAQPDSDTGGWITVSHELLVEITHAPQGSHVPVSTIIPIPVKLQVATVSRHKSRPNSAYSEAASEGAASADDASSMRSGRTGASRRSIFQTGPSVPSVPSAAVSLEVQERPVQSHVAESAASTAWSATELDNSRFTARPAPHFPQPAPLPTEARYTGSSGNVRSGSVSSAKRSSIFQTGPTVQAATLPDPQPQTRHNHFTQRASMDSRAAMTSGPSSPLPSREPYFPTPAAPPVQPASTGTSAPPHRRSFYESPPPVYSNNEPIDAGTLQIPTNPQRTDGLQNGETSHPDARVAQAHVPAAADGPHKSVRPTALADKPKRKSLHNVPVRQFATDKSTGQNLQDLPIPSVPFPKNQAALDSLLVQGAVTGPQYLEMREKLSALEALDVMLANGDLGGLQYLSRRNAILGSQ
ncbi:hypothetical protein BDZ88DRAFT_333559 [Geranomyces variabilis]|nr:hypothetical protein BDZ88DRAFT_333559 [Geranomyces variabilis]KAJ3132707.1 hypothetical protein HDU90_006759 [Geranomyces variabilis]